MEKDLISIIVPVYNVEQYLEECVQSIREQTYKNLEIILIDDGSADASGKMCDEYADKDERIKVVHKENEGQARAKNIGLDMCTGDYISFVDADDYVDPDYIGYMYRALCDNDVDISSCKWRFIFFNGKFEKEETEPTQFVESQKEFYKNLLYCKRAVGQTTFLFKRDIFNNLRYSEGIIFEDSDLVYKIIAKCDRVITSNKQLYYYRLRQGSTTNSSFDNKKLGLIDVSEKMCSFILERYPDLQFAAASKMVWACYSTLNHLYKAKTVDKKIEKMILDRAKPYEKTVLRDKNASSKDKLGILTRKFGRGVYMLSWKIYMKLFKS